MAHHGPRNYTLVHKIKVVNRDGFVFKLDKRLAKRNESGQSYNRLLTTHVTQSLDEESMMTQTSLVSTEFLTSVLPQVCQLTCQAL